MAIKHKASDGSTFTELAIRSRYAKSLRHKHQGEPWPPNCEGCEERAAVDNSHIVAKARCKQLHKVELIWDPENYFNACRICHHNWESFKSGQFIHLKNFETCMIFLKQHDPESFEKRMIVLETLTLDKDVEAIGNE